MPASRDTIVRFLAAHMRSTGIVTREEAIDVLTRLGYRGLHAVYRAFMVEKGRGVGSGRSKRNSQSPQHQ